jgi:DNA mismatch repair protein MutS
MTPARGRIPQQERIMSTTSPSVLFRDPGAIVEAQPPDFFHDLNLDQLVASITRDWAEYDLRPFFYSGLADEVSITYRQDLMRDVENGRIRAAIEAFAGDMRTMRRQRERAAKAYYGHEQRHWTLTSIESYVRAVTHLSDASMSEAWSEGLRTFGAYVETYVNGDAFRTLVAEVRRLVEALSQIRYTLLMRNGTVTVNTYDDRAEYTRAVEATFDKFRHGEAKDYRVTFRETPFTHVDGWIVDGLVALHPQLFADLAAFCQTCEHCLDETIGRFDREIHFYLSYLTYIERFRRAGLAFCRPRVSGTSKGERARSTFDLALADKLLEHGGAVVTNDFDLRGPERVFVVTGPNQGGKTTFARTVGQLHHLARLGLLVPGTEADLFVCDQILTHFEREEHVGNLRGKLHDDLVRIREILTRATPNSLVIMNEIFSSTTLKDAVYLSQRVMAEIARLDLLAVCVTFLSELASGGRHLVSLVSLVDPRDPAIRTYKLDRQPASDTAYAVALAEKHGLTYERLANRIPT